jgi:hypothetical protein
MKTEAGREREKRNGDGSTERLQRGREVLRLVRLVEKVKRWEVDFLTAYDRNFGARRAALQ